jgi:NPCBM/NEW2 domain
MWLDLAASPAAAKPTVWIEMLDGSRMAAAAYGAAEGKARITLATGQTIEAPTRTIHAVRFHPPAPELAVQWREITSSMAAGDMLVIRKTSTRTIEQGDSEPRTVTEQALDQLEGTLLDVTSESVQFETDGQKILVRRDKLEGIVYYHPAKREFSSPLCRLSDAAGSSWPLRELKLVDGRLIAVTPGNVGLDLPLDAVDKLDFSIGNVAFLSDLEADSGAGEIALGLQPAAMNYKFSRMFQLRAGPPLGAAGFRIGGQNFDSGLSLHSPTKLVYRVPEGFRKFYAVAGVDDSVVAPGPFNLVILGDGKELARHAFTAEERRQPLPLTLDVKGVRRVTIQLEAAEGQDIGDQLDLCEARFTR